MMDLFTLPVFVICALATLFAGISKGGFGSGVAFASAAILALVLDPGVALGLMLPLLMLIDVASLPAYWRKWDWGAGSVLIIGAVPGIVIGALFYAAANADLIRMIIGAVALAFVVWQAAVAYGLMRPGAQRFGFKAGIMAGLALGFTSFVSHAGGPAAAVFMLGLGLNKLRYQATTVLVFWIVNFLKSGIYAGMGIFTQQSLLLDLALAPFAVLGAWIGIRAHRLVPERLFFAITYVALTVTGLRLIWVALT